MGLEKDSVPQFWLVGFSLAPLKNCQIPAVCPIIQLSSDLSTQRHHQMPQVKGSVSQDCPPLQMPFTNPSCYLYFWPTGYKSEVPMTPSLGSINLLEWLRLRKPVCSLDHPFITNDINPPPDKEILRAWSQKKELLSLWRLGPNAVAHGNILFPQPGSS